MCTAATVAIRFLLAFSPFPRRTTRSARGLDHRDAFAVDRADQDLASLRLDLGCGALRVEVLEVDSRLAYQLLGCALGNAGRSSRSATPVPHRTGADDHPQKPPLAFVAAGAAGQPELLIERVDGPLAGCAVADAREHKLPGDGEDSPTADRRRGVVVAPSRFVRRCGVEDRAME